MESMSRIAHRRYVLKTHVAFVSAVNKICAFSAGGRLLEVDNVSVVLIVRHRLLFAYDPNEFAYQLVLGNGPLRKEANASVAGLVQVHLRQRALQMTSRWYNTAHEYRIGPTLCIRLLSYPSKSAALSSNVRLVVYLKPKRRLWTAGVAHTFRSFETRLRLDGTLHGVSCDQKGREARTTL
jgi:hypothetical protein